MISKIKSYCDNPTSQKFYDFSNTLKNIFYENSNKCIKRDKGNLKLAQTTINFYKADKMSQKQRNGINALLKAIRFLKFLKKKEDIKLPLKVFDNSKDPIITIEYEKELKGQYWTKENYKNNMEKEYEFYYDDLQDYLVDFIYESNIEIKEIQIGTKKFYNVEYGVVWNVKNPKKIKIKEKKERQEKSEEEESSDEKSFKHTLPTTAF